MLTPLFANDPPRSKWWAIRTTLSIVLIMVLFPALMVLAVKATSTPIPQSGKILKKIYDDPDTRQETYINGGFLTSRISSRTVHEKERYLFRLKECYPGEDECRKGRQEVTPEEFIRYEVGDYYEEKPDAE